MELSLEGHGGVGVGINHFIRSFSKQKRYLQYNLIFNCLRWWKLKILCIIVSFIKHPALTQ